MKQYKSVTHNVAILTASVPVVKLEISFAALASDLKIPGGVKIGHVKSVKIDLVIHDRSEQKAHHTHQCATFIRQQMMQHPFLKPITICLKKYFSLKNLNSPFQGSVSSYGLVLIVLALLNDLNKTGMIYEQHLGRTFAQFFMVFGDRELFNEQVMINSKSDFEVSNMENTAFCAQNCTSMLVIQDPVDFTNNVGK